MSKNQDSSVIRNETLSSIPLVQDYLVFHAEYGIKNFTGKTLYILHGTGEVSKVPYLGQYTDEFGQRLNNNGVQIQFIRKGRNDPDKSGNIRGVADKKDRTLVDIFVSNDKLGKVNSNGEYIDTPYYVAEFGFVISFNSSLDVLRRAHPGLHNSISNYVANALRRIPEGTSGAAPLYIIANSHNTSINRIYLIINDSICTVKVGHDFAAKESLDIYVSNGSGDILKYSMLTSAGFVDLAEPAENAFCIWGVNKDAVYKRLMKNQNDRSKLLTESEVNDRIAKALEEANAKITQYEAELKNERTRYSLLQKERDTYKTQLDEVNENAKKTFEQNMLERKEAIATKEAETKQIQLEAEARIRQAEESATRNKQEHEERMRRYDEDAAKLKAETERLKAENDERSRRYDEDLRQAKLREERERQEHEDRVRRYEEDLRKAKLREEEEERRYKERMQQAEAEAARQKAESEERCRRYEEELRRKKVEEEQEKQKNSNRNKWWEYIAIAAKALGTIITTAASIFTLLAKTG